MKLGVTSITLQLPAVAIDSGQGKTTAHQISSVLSKENVPSQKVFRHLFCQEKVTQDLYQGGKILLIFVQNKKRNYRRMRAYFVSVFAFRGSHGKLRASARCVHACACMAARVWREAIARVLDRVQCHFFFCGLALVWRSTRRLYCTTMPDLSDLSCL